MGMTTKKSKASNKELLSAIIMLSPFAVLFALFTLQPAFNAILMSFQTGPFTAMKFVGLANYIRLFQDPLIYKTFLNTLWFVMVSGILYIIVSVLFALWAQHPTRLSTFMRIAFYIPSVLVLTIVTSIWLFMFKAETGIWHYLTEGTALNKINWFHQTNPARWIIILSTLWWTVGGNMLIAITALRNIPTEILEAAQLDGASPTKTFLSITLPQIMPTIVVLVILQIIASFKIFGQPFVMTGGGPNHSTRSIIQYVYDVGFSSNNPGYAAAISVLFMIFLVILMLIQQYWGKRHHA